jgi:hypothetical protein
MTGIKQLSRFGFGLSYTEFKQDSLVVEVKDDATALEKNMAVRMAWHSAYQQAVRAGDKDLAERIYTAQNPNWQATNPYAFKFAWEQGLAAGAGGQAERGAQPERGQYPFPPCHPQYRPLFTAGPRSGWSEDTG